MCERHRNLTYLIHNGNFHCTADLLLFLFRFGCTTDLLFWPKPVKQELSCTVILTLAKQVSFPWLSPVFFQQVKTFYLFRWTRIDLNCRLAWLSFLSYWSESHFWVIGLKVTICCSGNFSDECLSDTSVGSSNCSFQTGQKRIISSLLFSTDNSLFPEVRTWGLSYKNFTA